MWTLYWQWSTLGSFIAWLIVLVSLKNADLWLPHLKSFLPNEVNESQAATSRQVKISEELCEDYVNAEDVNFHGKAENIVGLEALVPSSRYSTNDIDDYIESESFDFGSQSVRGRTMPRSESSASSLSMSNRRWGSGKISGRMAKKKCNYIGCNRFKTIYNCFLSSFRHQQKLVSKTMNLDNVFSRKCATNEKR